MLNHVTSLISGENLFELCKDLTPIWRRDFQPGGLRFCSFKNYNDVYIKRVSARMVMTKCVLGKYKTMLYIIKFKDDVSTITLEVILIR